LTKSSKNVFLVKHSIQLWFEAITSVKWSCGLKDSSEEHMKKIWFIQPDALNILWFVAVFCENNILGLPYIQTLALDQPETILYISWLTLS